MDPEMLVSEYKLRFCKAALLRQYIDPSRAVNPIGASVRKDMFPRASSKMISPTKEVQLAIGLLSTSDWLIIVILPEHDDEDCLLCLVEGLSRS